LPGFAADASAAASALLCVGGASPKPAYAPPPGLRPMALLGVLGLYGFAGGARGGVGVRKPSRQYGSGCFVDASSSFSLPRAPSVSSVSPLSSQTEEEGDTKVTPLPRDAPPPRAKPTVSGFGATPPDRARTSSSIAASDASDAYSTSSSPTTKSSSLSSPSTEASSSLSSPSTEASSSSHVRAFLRADATAEPRAAARRRGRRAGDSSRISASTATVSRGFLSADFGKEGARVSAAEDTAEVAAATKKGASRVASLAALASSVKSKSGRAGLLFCADFAADLSRSMAFFLPVVGGAGVNAGAAGGVAAAGDAGGVASAAAGETNATAAAFSFGLSGSGLSPELSAAASSSSSLSTTRRPRRLRALTGPTSSSSDSSASASRATAASSAGGDGEGATGVPPGSSATSTTSGPGDAASVSSASSSSASAIAAASYSSASSSSTRSVPATEAVSATESHS
jgi:hypothetical protein